MSIAYTRVSVADSVDSVAHGMAGLADVGGLSLNSKTMNDIFCVAL